MPAAIITIVVITVVIIRWLKRDSFGEVRSRVYGVGRPAVSEEAHDLLREHTPSSPHCPRKTKAVSRDLFRRTLRGRDASLGD